MMAVVPTTLADQSRARPAFDLGDDYELVKGKHLCLRCMTVVTNREVHRDGVSRNCDVIQACVLARAEQGIASLQGLHKAAPYTRTVRLYNAEAENSNTNSLIHTWVPSIRIYGVASRYDRVDEGFYSGAEPVWVGETLFSRNLIPWIDRWVWDVLNAPVLSPVFKRGVVRLMLMSALAQREWRSQSFQSALGACIQLGGGDAARNFIRAQPWWVMLRDLQCRK